MQSYIYIVIDIIDAQELAAKLGILDLVSIYNNNKFRFRLLNPQNSFAASSSHLSQVIFFFLMHGLIIGNILLVIIK